MTAAGGSKQPAVSERRRLRISVLASVHPLTTGAAQFNGAMVAAMRRRAAVDLVSWRRMYPRLLFRGDERDEQSRPPRQEPAVFLLDWDDPRTWRRALARIDEFDADAVVFPWLHPVMAPPYRWLLRRLRSRVARVVICHNVLPHERFRGSRFLTRATLRHADLLVTHTRAAKAELTDLGLGRIPRLHAFHPRFVPGDLAPDPTPAAIAAERSRRPGPGLSLLTFGAIRPYKGLDVALEALARVDPSLAVRLVVAGRFWSGSALYRAQIEALGLQDRVELREGYVSNEDAALLFATADAVLLPYRSATQSGVVQLAFAYGRPVIATRVGGLPEAIRDGVDGILSAPADPDDLACAIERMARLLPAFTEAVARDHQLHSFDLYAELIEGAVDRLAA